jgi:hypothetical protein
MAPVHGRCRGCGGHPGALRRGEIAEVEKIVARYDCEIVVERAGEPGRRASSTATAVAGSLRLDR